MSAGAVFKLIANDGKADKIIMATELLNARIRDIMCMRAKQGMADPTPSLVDIEKTHVLFINSHFKPFAAVAYEYNKVKPNSGNPQFGNSIQFSIPQFGDFFNDMVINVQAAATSATVGTVPAFPPQIGPDDFVSGAASQVSGHVNYPVAGTYTKYTQEYVLADGTVVNPGSAASNFVRYAEFVGERLFKKVKFEVNGNPLDDYDHLAMIFHDKLKVQPNKRIGWNRLVGQEVPIDAYSDLLAIQGASNWNSSIANLTDLAGNAAAGAPVSSAITARKVVQIVNGYQTPKAQQPVLDLWIPLLFWFNKDCRLSIPSVSIPFGQRFITVDIEQQSNLLFVAPGNLFLRLTVEEQVASGAGAGTAAALAVNAVRKTVTMTPVLATGSTINTTQQITGLELYINNIFVNPEIHDIFIKRIGFSLIRVHRVQTATQVSEFNSLLLSNMKWPIETMYLGLRPTVNTSAANPNQWRDWHRLTLTTDQSLETTSLAAGDVMIDNTVAFDAVSPFHKRFSSQELCERVTYPAVTETISTLKVVAHGIQLFDTYKAAFYRDYLSYTFGGPNIATPYDLGALMVNFCLYPGTYQPSGHLNVSRAREFYIDINSPYATSTTTADVLVLATAINFLLISDGSAVLRYST